MINNAFDPQDPTARPQQPSPTPPSAGPSYNYVGQDPTGAHVYQGSDGQMYTDDPGGVNGFKPYSGPGVPKAGGEVGPPPATPPPPGPGGPAGPSILDPIAKPFTPPAPVNLGGPAGIPYVPPTPSFTPPTFPTIPSFQAPSVDEALKEPGYQFRTGQGRDSLQNWAAARGTLNDSGTAKALIDYGQNAASQEYSNVWNRDYTAYQGDVNTKYLDPYAAEYKGWSDATLQPGLLGYQTQAAAGQHANDMNYQNAFNLWMQQFDQAANDRDSKFNKATTFAGL